MNSVIPALFVEPHIYTQLELLHAAQAARAPLALSCVATCGGAREALGSANFAYLLLSTSLCYDANERRELAALVQAARARGMVVLSFGPGDLSAFGLPVDESLSFSDVALGYVGEALERACQRAQLEWSIGSR
jgi:hypothetical protein